MGYIVTRALDIPRAPQWEFVNVAINGRYKGLYLLSEAVAQGEGRTDVADDGTAIEAAVKHNMLVNYNTTAGGFYDDSREMLAYLERRLPILDSKIEAMATDVSSPQVASHRQPRWHFTPSGIMMPYPTASGVYIVGGRKKPWRDAYARDAP